MEWNNAVLVSGTTAFIAVIVCVSVVGVRLVSKALDNLARQPEAAEDLRTLFLLGFSMVEIFFLVGILLTGFILYQGLSLGAAA